MHSSVDPFVLPLPFFLLLSLSLLLLLYPVDKGFVTDLLATWCGSTESELESAPAPFPVTRAINWLFTFRFSWARGGGGKGRKSNQKTKNPHSKKFPKYESNSRNTRLRYACYTLTISEIIQLLIIILQNNNEHLRIKNYASSSFLSNYESARGRGQTVNNAMPSCNTEKYYHQI